MARGQGFEPRLTGPKPAVLPLDDPRSENRSKLTELGLGQKLANVKWF